MKKIIAMLLALSLLMLLYGCAPTSVEQPELTPEPSADVPVNAPVEPVTTVTPAPIAATPVPAPTPITFPAKGYCNGEGVNLRAEPSTSGEVIDIMGQNAVLDVMALQDGWYKINMGGVTAYVSEKLITLGDPPRPHNMRWAKVSVAESQLYKSPTPNDLSDVKLKQGDVVKVLRELDGYLHVVYNFTFQRYLKAGDVTFISADEAMTAIEAKQEQAAGFPAPSASPAQGA